jgi:hypothetical protein
LRIFTGYWTLSKVDVFSAVACEVTTSPTYVDSFIVMVTEPTKVQFTPSTDTYPLKAFP